MDRNTQLVGQSSSFLDAVERASRAAPLDRPVLVIGERGTGKELIAERLHHLSSRWDGPLIIMNCAALPETLIEAELFGHEPGAFTGATKARPGRFEEANGGTLFLDELASLSSRRRTGCCARSNGGVTGWLSRRSRSTSAVAATTASAQAGRAGRFRRLLDRLSSGGDAAAARHRQTFRCSPTSSRGDGAQARWETAGLQRAMAQLQNAWPGIVRG